VRVRARTSPAAYRARVEAVRRRILRGDLFQANVSQRFEADVDGDAGALFERLVRATPAPFATFVGLGEGRAILSASPERFLALDEHGVVETRPMKGTRPRGATPAEDRRLLAALRTSAKDRAELAMIVDLSRNDLGRVCEPGTVRVTEARRLERYATVFQAVGVVRGRLRRGASGVDLIRAAFPPGSVTGAPKVEALRAIDALEREARGAYCGAIGWLDDGGGMDLAVAIRTVVVADGKASWRVGGGVTLASDPEAERVETLDKGRALARAVAGAR
jgi:anthranilate/para-aminobenzoate synthase component I